MDGAAARPSPAEMLEAGLTLHRHGRGADAAALYEHLLASDPAHRQALMLLGLVRADGPDVAAAEALFQRYLLLVPGDALALHNLGKLQQRRGQDAAALVLFDAAAAAKPAFAPIHNDRGVSLQRLERREAALQAFERAVALDPNYAVAQGNLGLVLVDMDRHQEAAAALRSAVTLAPQDVGGWYNLGLALVGSEQVEEGAAALRRALMLDPDHADARLQLAQLLARTHQVAAAEQQSTEWARRLGVSVTPCRGLRAEARILILGGSRICNAPTEALIDGRRFEKIMVHLLPPEEPDAEMAADRLPPADLVFNAVADADRGAPFLAPVAALGEKLGLPLLNAPARIPLTRRDRVPALLADIPHLVVPPVARLDRAALTAIAAADMPLPQPMLVRPAGAHGGDDLQRLDRAAELGPYLAGLPYEDFYWSPFCDYRSADGWFRKYRLVFVDREIYPYHLAIARNWLVHYWRADMREAEWMKLEEEAFLADWTRIFSADQAAAIRSVAQRLDLDYAGIDCALTEDGQVLLFEANASMLVHLNDSRSAFPYKHAYVPRIFEAMAGLVARRVAAAL